jgi:hypothetical protein
LTNATVIGFVVLIIAFIEIVILTFLSTQEIFSYEVNLLPDWGAVNGVFNLVYEYCGGY